MVGGGAHGLVIGSWLIGGLALFAKLRPPSQPSQSTEIMVMQFGGSAFTISNQFCSQN